MGTWHVVEQAERLSTIAAHHGITDWKTVWDDLLNAGLEQVRRPETLFPADRLYIPDKNSKTVPRGTGQQHTFVTQTPPTETPRVKVLDAAGGPLARQQFRLTVGTQKFAGTTTAEGVLDFHESGLAFPIAVGRLSPAHEKKPAEPDHYDNGVSGLQMRLANFGFNPGPPDGAFGPRTRSALQRFQATVMHLPTGSVTGDLDSETRDAIIRRYGC